MTKNAFLLLLVLGPLSARSATESLPDIASRETRNKAIAGRVFKEIFNQGKFQVADEIYAPDFKNHGLHRSIDLKEDQDAVHEEKSAFPDLRMSVDMMVAESDLVTVMWTLRGTHTGPGYGIPPTGTKVELRGMTIWRIVEGKIREEWTSYDNLDVFIQILDRVKWLLVGALFVVVVLLWALVKGIGGSRRRKATS